MTPPRPVVTVTPNPAWDLTYEVPELEPGGSVRVREVRSRAGGKGVNVARVLGALGTPSVAVCPLGGPLAGPFVRDLRAADQDVVVVPVAGALRQSITVVPDVAAADAGHPTVLNEPGPALGDGDWEDLAQAAARTCAAARGPSDRSRPNPVAAVCGSLPPGTRDDHVHALVGGLRDAGAHVVVDVWGPGLLWAAAAGADVLKVNRRELLEATGAADVARAVAALTGLGARAVVVTDGERGLDVHAAGRAGRLARAVLEAPVAGNPTGAGDAATAALALTSGEPWAHRLALAAAVAAAAVLQPTAGHVDPADVAPLLARVRTEA